MPLVFKLKCPNCGYEGIYTQKDVIEEDVYSFTCPVCKGGFYITRKPPLVVRCPHCNSTLRIVSVQEEPIVVKANYEISPSIIAVMLLGAFIGVMISKDKIKGALIGGFIGALIGILINTLSEPEAKYEEE